MVLVDFRKWSFGDLSYLPDSQKELLQRDFKTLNSIGDFKVIDFKKREILISDLFLENKEVVAVSSVNNLSDYFKTIDVVLEKKNKEVIDYTDAADEEVYFYGSNSLVAHHTAEIGICGVNKNSDESLFEEYCEDFELTPFSFELPEGIFTSDIAFFTINKLFICLDYIQDKKEKKQLFSILKSSGIELVSFTKEQVEQKVFNMKLLEDGHLLILQSTYDLFTEKQKAAMLDLDIEIIKLPFLEEVGVSLNQLLF